MSHPDKYFIADYNSDDQEFILDEKEDSEVLLQFSSGDKIWILNVDEEWMFGEHSGTGQRGWVELAFGHIRNSSPYISMSSDDMSSMRKIIFMEILRNEEAFVTSLSSFIKSILTPLYLRDTDFKRSFLGEPSIAVCMEILKAIHTTSSMFHEELLKACSGREMANCYTRYAAAFSLFSQYASENTAALSVIKVYRKSLSKFLTDEVTLPEEISFEAFMISPLKHYSKYRANLEEFVWLTPIQRNEYTPLSDSLDMVIAQCDSVDAKLKEEEENIKLLAIQSHFADNTIIFKPGRTLIQEGDVDLLRSQSIKGDADLLTCCMHLFNDTLIYSAKKISIKGVSYKLRESIDLKGVSAKAVDPAQAGGQTNAFVITSIKDGDMKIIFRCGYKMEADEWVAVINRQADLFKKSGGNVGGPNAKRSVPTVAASEVSLKGMEESSMGPRASCIHQFLSTEMIFSDILSTLMIIMIQPLINASKGSPLVVPTMGNDKPWDNKIVSSASSGGFLNTIGGFMSKSPSQMITDDLQNADVQVFLRAFEGLSIGVSGLVRSIESACISEQWKESVCIGPLFNTVSSRALYEQYKSYASSHKIAWEILKSSRFASFISDVERTLQSQQRHIDDGVEGILHFPMQHIDKYLVPFAKRLDALTSEDHLDKPSISNAQLGLQEEATDVAEVARIKENFGKLLEIQNSFLLTTSLFSADPVLSTLASTDRTFIKEGDLKKACRKNDKVFRFWLFNDLILYGSALGGDKYQFHRSIDLSTCSIGHHNSGERKYAFEIFGSEKSFVVMAPSLPVQSDWMNAIEDAITNLNGDTEGQRVIDNENDAEGGSLAVAPVWVADNLADKCTVCKQSFTMFKRRHHCRKCGKVVCGDHSSKSIIIPHIHAATKQRVCDPCYDTKDLIPVVAPVPPRKSQTKTTAAARPASVWSSTPSATPILSINTVDAHRRASSAATESSSSHTIISHDFAKPPLSSDSSPPMKPPKRLNSESAAPPAPISSTFPNESLESPTSNNPFGDDDDIVTPPNQSDRSWTGPPPLPTAPPPLPTSPPPPLPTAPPSDDECRTPRLPPPPIPTVCPPPLSEKFSSMVDESLQIKNPTTPESSVMLDSTPATLEPSSPTTSRPKSINPFGDDDDDDDDDDIIISAVRTQVPDPSVQKHQTPPPPPRQVATAQATAQTIGENPTNQSHTPLQPPPRPRPTSTHRISSLNPRASVKSIKVPRQDILNQIKEGLPLVLDDETTDMMIDNHSQTLTESSVGSPNKVPKPRMTLLEQIQSGPKLKNVQQDESVNSFTKASSNTLLDTLAVEMFKRRVNIQKDDSDSDASGFSDGD